MSQNIHTIAPQECIISLHLAESTSISGMDAAKEILASIRALSKHMDDCFDQLPSRDEHGHHFAQLPSRDEFGHHFDNLRPQFQHFNTHLAEFRAEARDQFVGLNGKLTEVLDRFARVDEISAEIREGFGKADLQFEKVGEGFGKVDQLFAKVNQDFPKGAQLRPSIKTQTATEL
ncbi:hypothetical protein B9Z19DRAFT_1121699 [Tuber borchii]|uniref:Uncharacterized protein n=1 Tax=Tuber borchii TaxID=42251 RepID=A0A2T7A228_TUBBO|nr:hypothetical protein B9Z19DRAFT_1121699 [Tuber borchii]